MCGYTIGRWDAGLIILIQALQIVGGGNSGHVIVLMEFLMNGAPSNTHIGDGFPIHDATDGMKITAPQGFVKNQYLVVD
jgi:hypothetical protein